MSSITESPDRSLVAPAAATSAVTLQIVSGPEWEATIGAFDGVSEPQLFTFARARWPNVALEPVLVLAGGEAIGGCLIMLQRLPLGLATIAVAKFGPFLRSGHGDALGRYGLMVDALVDAYARQRRMMLSLLPLPALGQRNAEFDLLLSRGFHRGPQMAFNDRYIVNLGLPEDAQRRSFSQTWRRQLAKAEKSGLSFERAAPTRFRDFDDIYSRLIHRKGFSDNSAYQETIGPLLDMSNDILRPELFLVSEGETPIAGAIIFKAGDRAVYLYGATDDRALPLRAGYFLHWNIIAWLKANTSARWYDLGGTDGFAGLHQFKIGMVGDAGMVTPVPPTANYAVHSLPFLIGETALWARHRVQQIRARALERRHRAEAAGS